MKETPYTFLIDADGTMFMHDYPYILKEVPHAIRILHRLNKAGHVLILHTNRHGEELEHAIAWAKDHGIEFFAVNENPSFETGSRKIYGNWHIDDHNLGGPLIYDPKKHTKPYVDWLRIEKALEEMELI